MKKAFLFTPALLALSISTISNAHAYDHLYVFGDSLSDGGINGRFTTNQEELYDEYLSQALTGKNLKDSGTNYAAGGATALRMPRDNFWLNLLNPNTKAQVNRYLKQNNGKADSNGIYIHWVGGNDLAVALETGAKLNAIKAGILPLPEEMPKEPSIIIKDSANAAAQQINQLVNAGAGLIIAPTVPDVGTTPKLLETVLSSGLEQKLAPVLTAKLEKEGKSSDEIKKEIKKEIATKIKDILTEIHIEVNKHDIPSGTGRELALQKVFDGLAQKAHDDFGLDSEKVKKELIEGYAQASVGATKLTNNYNNIVDDEISKSGGNILRADIYSLLHEVIDSPFTYGFSNNLGYACGLGISSSECKKGKNGFDSSKEFIFSDNFHPSPLAHKIMGQYIESIYIAPSQVMTLNQVNRAPVKGTRASLDGHLQQLRSGGNEQGKTGVFGGYSGGRNTTFTLGGDYQLTESLLLGALYSNDNTERSPTSNFSYQSDAHVATAYGLWNVFNKAWLSGDLHYANINYDSLTRSIKLGQATRREVGSTTGTQWGARLTANWDIPVTNIVTTSPIVQFSWDKGDVKGYRESGHQSSAMHFSDQSYTSKIATLGWRVDTQLGRFNPYASVQFNHQFGDTQSKMRSAINSTKTSFVVDSGKQSKDWHQYTVGANANLFGNVRGFASVTRNEGSAQDANYDFSLGINASF
ncbi:autotransporter outer membrane beta-barrel domain-containing protein [Xenorhabdus bharatensis]|uniref:autotransporter outer membrane beta-barrel domain-containing protein n=1 Tax=Xenorhabdus bharatensis TaxID=3136256 RepID=UPI0030F41357